MEINFIAVERNFEKEAVRNRRKEDRRHKILPEERKMQEYRRQDSRYYGRIHGTYLNGVEVNALRATEKERTLRADAEIESAIIAEIRERQEAERKWEIEELKWELADMKRRIPELLHRHGEIVRRLKELGEEV